MKKYYICFLSIISSNYLYLFPFFYTFTAMLVQTRCILETAFSDFLTLSPRLKIGSIFFLTFSPQLVEYWSNFASSLDQFAQQPSMQFKLYMSWAIIGLQNYHDYETFTFCIQFGPICPASPACNFSWI